MNKINPWTFSSQQASSASAPARPPVPPPTGDAQSRLGANNSYNLQGASQDALVSFSPEALDTLSQQQQQAQGAQGGGAELGQQLEQQIETGDLQSALETVQQLEANAPGGSLPQEVQGLHDQLVSQLQAGDQQGAEETLSQIQAQRPQPPGPSLSQQ